MFGLVKNHFRKFLIAIFALLFAFSVTLCLGFNSLAYNSSVPDIIGGDGYGELGEEYYGYYRIATADQLLWFCKKAQSDPYASALLVADIKLNSDLFSGITIDEEGVPAVIKGMVVNEWDVIPTFLGVFDGGGHTISGLYIDEGADKIGMFGTLYEGGKIRNLTIADSYVHSLGNSVGVLTGESYGEISGVAVTATGSVGKECIGGIVGMNFGTVQKSFALADIQGAKYIGGIAGVNDGAIDYCYSASGCNVVGGYGGGIAGKSAGEISYCYSMANVMPSMDIVDGGQVAPIAITTSGASKFVSNYYLASEELDSLAGTEYKTATAFASGEVCYLLNAGGEVFFQNLDGDGAKDKSPVLFGNAVFKCAKRVCPGIEDTKVFYSNTENNDKIEYPDHNYVSDCDVFCDSCGFERSGATEHTVNDKCGDVACSACGEAVIPQHEYSSACDEECDTCGEARKVTHSYKYACSVICSLCQAEREVDFHSYSGACDATCNVCGFLRGAEEHSFVDGEGKCSVCGDPRECPEHIYSGCLDANCNLCGATREVVGHEYENDCAERCNKCGEGERASTHQYTGCDGTECINCGAPREAVPHTYLSSCDAVCQTCGYIRVAPHNFENECDSACDGCDYIRDVSHDYDGDLCNSTCVICSAVRADGEHSFSSECDTDCDVCGAPKETVTHTYDNSCDPYCNICGDERDASHQYESSCDADCNVCGEERDASHQYENDCDSNCNICGDERYVTHQYKNNCDADCDACGEQREASHQYENACDSICDACGFERAVGEHKFGEYYTTLEPTETEDGVRVRECEICGAVESEPISAIGNTGGGAVIIVIVIVVIVLLLLVIAFVVVKKLF